MATMTKSSRTRNKPAAKPAAKHAKPVKKGKVSAAASSSSAAKSPGKKSATATKKAPAKLSSHGAAREKKFVEIFGAVLGKLALNAQEKTCPTLTAAADDGVCVLQFSPRTDRMTWVSVTHGLSEHGKGGHTELLVHWRARDAKMPVKLLSHAARYAIETGAPLTHGSVLAAGDEKAPNPGIAALPHWLICPPDQLIADQLQDAVKVALLVGITEAELQFALKVKPELADGRKVLFEALRVGQVYPVTDPNRGCMTRRRDFHRIWEAAFSQVRHAAPAAQGAGARGHGPARK